MADDTALQLVDAIDGLGDVIKSNARDFKLVGRETEVYYGAGKDGKVKPGWYKGRILSLEVEFEDGTCTVADEPGRFCCVYLCFRIVRVDFLKPVFLLPLFFFAPSA